MEERLRIGSQLLLSRATATEAGRAFAALADAAVGEMARAAAAEVGRRHGPAPGRWAVLGLGKLGGRELSADSDLDLMVVYEADKDRSVGERPLGTEAWFVRFTQRLVTALSSPTEEGELYPVDMALRPSGSAGPIAVRLSRFREYYDSGEAWTWERMALTRGRVVAHDGLGDDVEAAIDAAVARPVDDGAIRADARDMRLRLLRDKPAKSDWDLKLRAGGLIEIEFIAQTAQLVARDRVSSNTREALRRLSERGVLPAEDADALESICEDYAALTQLMRAAHGGGFDPERASAPFAARLCAALDAPDLAHLEQYLSERADIVRGLFQRHVGDLQAGATDQGAPPRR
jgi:glutamate-ammonia-ligase adenylyltransferase